MVVVRLGSWLADLVFEGALACGSLVRSGPCGIGMRLALGQVVTWPLLPCSKERVPLPFYSQERDSSRPFPKEIPHNEKLLSLTYEVGLPLLCLAPEPALSLLPMPGCARACPLSVTEQRCGPLPCSAEPGLRQQREPAVPGGGAADQPRGEWRACSPSGCCPQVDSAAAHRPSFVVPKSLVLQPLSVPLFLGEP